MRLPLLPPLAPMLARPSTSLPPGEGWLYEPKWDGFRCVVFRDGDEIELQSRNGRSLNRYFPELVEGLKLRLPERIVVDGEIVIEREGVLDFEALLLRIHPAASRVERLARSLPASFVAFDLLCEGDEDLTHRAQEERRARLEQSLVDVAPPIYLTPATLDRAQAMRWFEHFEGAGFDGVIAKPLMLPYVCGRREMVKVKHQRTADCVVGGFREHRSGDGVGSLLLGLYDEDGRLQHVGVASGLSGPLRRELSRELLGLREGAEVDHPWRDGDPGDACEEDGEERRVPGAPSRWTGTRDLSWEPVRPERVVEVAYDHLQGRRFRHATRFVRWRPDRDPLSCTYAQLDEAPPRELLEIFREPRRSGGSEGDAASP